MFAHLVCNSSSSVLPVVFGQKIPSGALWCAGVTVESKVVLFWLILSWFLSLVAPCFLGHYCGGRGGCVCNCTPAISSRDCWFFVLQLYSCTISLVISSVSCVFFYFLFWYLVIWYLETLAINGRSVSLNVSLNFPQCSLICIHASIISLLATFSPTSFCSPQLSELLMSMLESREAASVDKSIRNYLLLNCSVVVSDNFLKGSCFWC